MFLFVDQILRLDPGKSAVGVRHVTADDPFMRPSADGDGLQAMMSCVVGETLGQLGAWSVMVANDFTLRPVAGIVGAVEIHGEANAGTPLLLETTIDSVDNEAVRYHAVATSGGRKVLTLEDAVGPFLPMDEFSDTALVRRQYASLDRPGDSDGRRWVEDWPPSDGDDSFAFDNVTPADDGLSLVATKHVTADRRFFVDHFQRKPVVPLSLLLEALLEQTTALLGDATLRPRRARSIKMRRFLTPGDDLTATILVKDRTDDRARVQFRCDINGKRACTASAELARDAGGDTA